MTKYFHISYIYIFLILYNINLSKVPMRLKKIKVQGGVGGRKKQNE